MKNLQFKAIAAIYMVVNRMFEKDVIPGLTAYTILTRLQDALMEKLNSF